MSKRFTDTDKWERPWFRNLPGEYKMLWCYILDKCDISGVWYVDIELASFLLKIQFIKEEAEDVLKKQIEVKGDRWFIKDFIPFQYGNLNPENKLYHNIQRKLGDFKEGASMPHTCPIYGAKDKDKDINVVVFKKTKEELKGFDYFWSVYPKKVGKGAAEKAWKNVPGHIEIARVVESVKKQSQSEDWRKEGGKYIPHPTTWLNQRRWEDELEPSNYRKESVGLDKVFRRENEKREVGDVSDLLRGVDEVAPV